MPKIGPDERVRKPYRERDRLLRRAGFGGNYAAYLASPLWRRIRKAQLKRCPDCIACEGPADQVHHADYSRETLHGTNPGGLLSVCGHHHRLAEFAADGSKRTPEEATAKLIEMSGDARRFVAE